MTEIAPGVHSLGHGKGGHVHAFLIDHGGELTLVDTLFESDGRLVFEAIRQLGEESRGSEADRDHARAPLAPRGDGGDRSRERRSAVRARMGGRHRLGRPPRAGGQPLAAAVAEAHPVPDRALARPPEARCVPRGRPAPRRRCVRAVPGAARARSLARPSRLLVAGATVLIAGDGVATWPELCPGWHSFNLNRPQHHATLQRLAALDAVVVGVGHGDPITDGAPDKVHELASRPVP